MPTIRAPPSKEIATFLVAVKCRPLTESESSRCQHIIQITDGKGLTVLDPNLSKGFPDSTKKRTKERKYFFDHVFGPECTNEEVYRKISSTIAGVIQGLNATVFAYGSTGSGKTYTMVGTGNDLGLMVLSFNTIFDLIKEDASSDTFEVSCSYLEVYNEVIYDLLENSSGHLELREDPEHGIIVAGLKSIKVQSADKILELFNLGNSRRKTECTEDNATSSRSHAVLEVTVKRNQNEENLGQILRGKLALVDLAGSERALETNSGGQRLKDGANINRSLLALANCINALGNQQKKGLAYVPYRNSKLTQILKDGLNGNSQTVMVATISPADDQYHHTVNTLKYADRAKEIKTHVHKNIRVTDTHVVDYQRMIENLQVEVCRLRKELAEKDSLLSSQPAENVAHDEPLCLNILSHETSENVQERINLQKALFELEETNLRNHIELEHLDDAIAKQQAIEKDETIVQALRSRRQIILDNIRDNDEARAGYQEEIELNEKCHSQLQHLSEEAISNNGNKNYLHIISQYRLLGMANTELQFEIAMRDQFIHKQRETQRSLWKMLLGLGLDQKQITDLAAKKAALVADLTLPHLPSSPYLDLSGLPHESIPSDFQQHEGFSSMASLKGQHHGHVMCRPESNLGKRRRGRPPLSRGFISPAGSVGHQKQPKDLVEYSEPVFTNAMERGSERVDPPETTKEPFVAKTNKRAIRKTIDLTGLEFADDLTNAFETDEVFTSRDALIQWCQNVGRQVMTIVIVQKSEKTTSIRKGRLVLGCERGGIYRDHNKKNLSKAEQKSFMIVPKQTGTKQQKIRRRKTAGTRKCNCPFELRGIPLGNDTWKLEVLCGKHNHELPKTLVGHAYVGRLSLEEKKILVDMTLSGVAPKEVLTTIKRQNGTNLSTVKTIYNAKAKLKLGNIEGRMQKRYLSGKERENGEDMLLANSLSVLINPHMMAYLELLPEVMRPYIEDIQDVTKDGNCGYRAVASLLGLSPKTGWKQVRNDMIQEMLKNRSFYETFFGVDFYSEVGKILDCYDSPCPANRWMQMPDMGYLVSTTYQCVLVLISEDQCLTFLPLLDPPVPGTPHQVISIGFVYRGHYVKLFLKKDAPLPPIGTMWIKHHKEAARGWAEPYEDRMQEFLRVVPQSIPMIDFVDEMKIG